MDAKEWNRIMREWNAEFPFLKRFGNSKLFFKTDIMLIGIWFDRILGEWYRPMIECIPLWYDSMDSNHNHSWFLAIRNERNHTVECQYIFHNRYFKRNTELVNQHYGSLLSGNVKYSELYALLEEWFGPYRGLNCLYHMYHLQCLILLAAYFNDSNSVENILLKIEKYCAKWEKNPREIDRARSENISFDEWRDKIYSYYGDREAFMSVCKRNSEDSKIVKLNNGILINEPPITEESFWKKLKSFFGR